MRKIRASVVERLEKAKLTNKELSIFLHLCQYQTEAGTVSFIMNAKGQNPSAFQI